MNALHELKKLYALKQITQEEYKRKEERFILLMIDLYCEGIINKEELHKRIME